MADNEKSQHQIDVENFDPKAFFKQLSEKENMFGEKVECIADPDLFEPEHYEEIFGTKNPEKKPKPKPEPQTPRTTKTSTNEEKSKDSEISYFFQGPLLALRKALSDNEMKQFASLKTNSERVAFIMNYPNIFDLPIELEDFEGKDDKKALSMKSDGNEIFSMGYYVQAIDTYSRAILLASKITLPVLLANRSAALYRMEMFQMGLSDCEEVLRMGYLPHLIYKIEERRARCALALNLHDKAIEAFQKALRALDDSKLPLEKRQKLENDIMMMLALMGKGKQLKEQKKTASLEKEKEKFLTHTQHRIPKMTECNPLYPALSIAAELRYGENQGRYVVATRDVQPGEIVAIEKAHCAALLEEYQKNHCHFCFIRATAPYPPACTQCINVAYCSLKCRNADQKNHELECSVLTALWCSKASVTSIMAIKAILQKPYSELMQLKDKLEEDLVITRSKPYRSSDYRTFHKLVTHEKKRTSEDLFHRAFMAAWLLRVLKTTSYIPEEEKTVDSKEAELSKSELYIAGELLHNLQLLQFNSHEVSELTRPMGKINLQEATSVFVGGGVYPTVALFNHSCNPGIVRYFVGTTMVVRAIRTISAGNEICENYGPIFTETPVIQRQQQLRLQYWFDCSCEACKNNWPLLCDIDPTVLRFKCDTGPECGNVIEMRTDSNEFMIKCKKCDKNTVILKGLKALQDTDSIYKTASSDLVAGNHVDSYKSFLTILKILDKTLALPIRDYHLCQEGIRRCLLAMGNIGFVMRKRK